MLLCKSLVLRLLVVIEMNGVGVGVGVVGAN
jgi:hypothetical protein